MDPSFKEKFAAGCRILAKNGHADSLAGQITIRDSDGATFWTTRFGLGLGEAAADNMVRIDETLSVVEGNGRPNPAVRFHIHIYEARPDIACIVHTHAPYSSALSMLGEDVAIAHMDTCPLHDDCAFLKDWPGLPFAELEAAIICTALGRKSSILLAHHGLLTTGAGIEAAVYRAVTLERAAKLQLLARAAGQIRQIDPAAATQARDFLLSDEVIGATFDYWSRMAQSS